MNTKNLLKALTALPVLIFLIVGSVILIIAGGIAIFSSIVAFIIGIACISFNFVLDFMNVSMPIMSIDDKYEPYVLGGVFLYIFLNMIFGFIKRLKKDKNNN